jgi:hypothetical protein
MTKKLRTLIVNFASKALEETQNLTPYIGASRSDVHNLLAKIVKAFSLLKKARERRKLYAARRCIYVIRTSCYVISYLLFWEVNSPFHR